MSEEIIQQAEERRGPRIILAVPKKTFSDFFEFIRERGVASLAIAFILGGAAQKLVQALMDDIINPLVGIFLGRAQNLSEYSIGIFRVGDFASVLLNFFILCAVVYLIFKLLKLEKIDIKK